MYDTKHQNCDQRKIYTMAWSPEHLSGCEVKEAPQYSVTLTDEHWINRVCPITHHNASSVLTELWIFFVYFSKSWGKWTSVQSHVCKRKIKYIFIFLLKRRSLAFNFLLQLLFIYWSLEHRRTDVYCEASIWIRSFISSVSSFQWLFPNRWHILLLSARQEARKCFCCRVTEVT